MLVPNKKVTARTFIDFSGKEYTTTSSAKIVKALFFLHTEVKKGKKIEQKNYGSKL